MAQDCKLAGHSRLTFLCCNMKVFLASSLSLYYFSPLNTTVPHNLIKDKLTELIEQILIERARFIWPVMRNVLFHFDIIMVMS